MRVMLDTNVLISALLFPSEKMNRLFETIVIDHTMVLSSYVIDELLEVLGFVFQMGHSFKVSHRIKSITNFF